MAGTKEEFIKAYERRIVALYAWTADKAKLAGFMMQVRKSVFNMQRGWDYTSPAAVAAWQEIGYSGEPTLRQLFNLPDDNVPKNAKPRLIPGSSQKRPVAERKRLKAAG